MGPSVLAAALALLLAGPAPAAVTAPCAVAAADVLAADILEDGADAGPQRPAPPGDPDAWRTLVLDHATLRWRARWPVGVPFPVGVTYPRGQDPKARLVLVPRSLEQPIGDACMTESASGLGRSLVGEREIREVFGPIALGPQRVVFDLVFEEPRWGGGGQRGTWVRRVPLGAIELEVVGVARAEDALTPRTDPDLLRRVVRSLAVFKSTDFDAHPVLGFWGRTTAIGLPVSLACQLQRRGTTVQEFVLRAPLHGLDATRVALTELPWTAFHAPAQGGPWTVVVRGTPDEALNTWAATSYWAGEVVIPLEYLRRELDTAQR